MLQFMVPVLHTMLQIFTFLVIGFVLRRYNWFSKDFFTSLGRFVVRLALPMYFFVRMSQADVIALQRAVRFPLLAIGLSAIAVTFGWMVFARLPFSRQDRKAGIAMSGFGNASYLPLSVAELMPLSMPIVAELFDTELALFYVGAYVFLFSPLLWSFGMVFISGQSPRKLVHGLISPPMIGIATGLVASLTGVGALLTDSGTIVSAIFPALERIGSITIPIILIVLGSMAGDLHIHGENWKSLLGMSCAVSVVRLVAMPALFFLFAPWFGNPASWSPTELWVIFLQFTTPPATNLSVMAAHHDINREHTTFTLLFTYLLYLLVFPLFLMLFLYRFQFL